MPLAACALRRRPDSELMVTLVFFLSGGAGLIFEMVWLHRAGLVFGNSLWSTSIVLSAFMGGLALGNALVAWPAGLLNLSAAAVMLAVTRRVAETSDVANDAEHVVMPTSPLARRLLVSAFLAGVSLMALEVIWFRFLSMFVFNSTLTLSIMLAVVLVGIAAGGLIGAAWLGRGPDASAYVSAVAFAAV